MSKMNELSQVLDELTTCGNNLKACGEELIRTASTLLEYFSGENEQSLLTKEEPATEAPASVPKAEAKKLSFVDVRKAFSAKSHAGYTEQVKALIGKYGADKLSAVKEEDYEALMADLEAIG